MKYHKVRVEIVTENIMKGPYKIRKKDMIIHIIYKTGRSKLTLPCSYFHFSNRIFHRHILLNEDFVCLHAFLYFINTLIYKPVIYNRQKSQNINFATFINLYATYRQFDNLRRE